MQSEPKRQAKQDGAPGRPLFSEEAERAILGACMLKPDQCVPVVIERIGLNLEAFYAPQCRVVWNAIVNTWSEHGRVDTVLVTDLLRKEGHLDVAGGTMAVVAMVDDCTTTETTPYHVDIVYRDWQRRRVIEKAREIIEQAADADDGDRLAMAAAAEFDGLLQFRAPEHTNSDVLLASVEKWREAFRKREEGRKDVYELDLPWDKMNEALNGLQPGMIVIGGRTSAGKTSLEGEIMLHLAERGHFVARFTNDSPREELIERMAARKAEVSLPAMAAGYAGDRKLSFVTDFAKAELKRLPMLIDDRTVDVKDICAMARALKRKQNMRVMSVDYIQAVRARDLGGRESDPRIRVSHVATKLKQLALELKIPILVLSQLRREAESADRSGEPELVDLMESGVIEQDARQVVLLWQDKWGAQADALHVENGGNPCDNPTRHLRAVWAKVAKYKGGPREHKCALWMEPAYFKFSEDKAAAFPQNGLLPEWGHERYGERLRNDRLSLNGTLPLETKRKRRSA
jgi:replicative DNA helicase